MQTPNITASNEAKNVVIYLLSSILFTNILFFIDEGYNSFYWMTKAGNWFAFGIYVFVLFAIQVVINSILANKITNSKARIVSIVLGLPIALTILFTILSN